MVITILSPTRRSSGVASAAPSARPESARLKIRDQASGYAGTAPPRSSRRRYANVAGGDRAICQRRLATDVSCSGLLAQALPGLTVEALPRTLLIADTRKSRVTVCGRSEGSPDLKSPKLASAYFRLLHCRLQVQPAIPDRRIQVDCRSDAGDCLQVVRRYSRMFPCRGRFASIVGRFPAAIHVPRVGQLLQPLQRLQIVLEFPTGGMAA